MDIDFEELYRIEMEDFDLILDEIGIPKELFKECFQSIGEMELLNNQVNELREEDKTLTNESPAILELKKLWDIANERYKRLENACPDVPYVCFNALVIAYEGLQEALDSDSPQDKVHDFIRAAQFRGVAMIFGKGFKEGIHAVLNEPRRNILSKAGAKGALVRLQPYAELKKWALEKGAKLGASKAVARTLANQLPSHFAQVSEDPERLIYETLRNRDKPN